MNELNKSKIRTIILVATAIIVIFAVVTNFGTCISIAKSAVSILSPLLTGAVLAFILATPMRKIEQIFEFINKKSKSKRKIPEKAIIYISLILTYVLATIALGFVILIIVPAVVDSVSEIVTMVKSTYGDIVKFIEENPKVIAFFKDQGINAKDITKYLSQLDYKSLIPSVTINAGKVFTILINSASGVFSVVVNIVTTIIFSIYLLAGKRRLKKQSDRFIDAYFPGKKGENAHYVLDLVISTFSKFFSGQCIEAIILGLIFLIILSVTGFPYAPVISVLIAVTAFIPYVGAFVGCAVGALLILMDSGPIMMLIFIAIFLVVQQLENNIIYPRVVGTSIGLPAIWTFAALIVGGAVYGVVGMLVFIPVTSIIYTLVKHNIAKRLDETAPPQTEAVEPEGEAPSEPVEKTESEENN